MRSQDSIQSAPKSGARSDAFRFFSIFFFAYVLLFSDMAMSSEGLSFQNLTLNEFLEREYAVSLEKIKQQISPADGAPGAVIASPSRRDPDYYYHWVRDGGLVMHVMVELYKNSPVGSSEKQYYMDQLKAYAQFSRKNQLTRTQSGLGEPKFYVDGNAFNGAWGRPQNDSPAIRALTLIRWARQLIKEGQADFVQKFLYTQDINPPTSVIKADLEYVSHLFDEKIRASDRWMDRCFDLWEEFRGVHFYTRMLQRQALEEGAELADLLGDVGAGIYYRYIAAQVASSLKDHWSEAEGKLRVTVPREDWNYKSSGFDASVVLAVLHTGKLTGEYSATDSKIIRTAEAFKEVERNRHNINKQNPALPGVAIGRYPEDRYYNGNPWFLTTLAYAEFAYRRALVASNLELARKLRLEGDAQVRRVQLYIKDGSMSEQFNRDNGRMESARDLTWSYASFITAAWARQALPEEVLAD